MQKHNNQLCRGQIQYGNDIDAKDKARNPSTTAPACAAHPREVVRHTHTHQHDTIRATIPCVAFLRSRAVPIGMPVASSLCLAEDGSPRRTGGGGVVIVPTTHNKNVAPPAPGSHPFEVDDADHCETPLKAYQDLTVVLDRLLLHKDHARPHQNKNGTPPRKSLRIYDPYYCDGGIKTKLASLGFTHVSNENRDFYQDAAAHRIPDHDVLVTNPPYSGRHMERLLAFCASRTGERARPALLLLPHFVYTKDYYARALAPAPTTFCSFLVPQTRYSYVPPAWVQHRRGAAKALAKGKDTTAPFPSFWYCCHLGGGRTTATTGVSHPWLEATFGAAGSVHAQHASGLRYARVPREIPRDFKGEFDPGKKRANPRARKRMRKLAAMGAHGGGPPPPPPQQEQQQQQNPDFKKKKQRRH